MRFLRSAALASCAACAACAACSLLVDTADLAGPAADVDAGVERDAASPDAGVEASADGMPPGARPVHVSTKTGSAVSSSSVIVSGVGSGGALHLAALSMKPSVSVASVSGLGLSWSKLDARCSAREATAVEVWAANGVASEGTVTATLASEPLSVVMSVSRYDNARAARAVASANTNGVSGACTGGMDTDTYAVRAPAAPTGLLFGAVALRLYEHAPGSCCTELVELRQNGSGPTGPGNASGLALVETTSDEVRGSFSNLADWAVALVAVDP